MKTTDCSFWGRFCLGSSVVHMATNFYSKINPLFEAPGRVIKGKFSLNHCSDIN